VKCLTHNTEAVGVCAYCGRAICSSCLENGLAASASSTTQASQLALPKRLACSTECASALTEEALALRQLLKQSLQNARASAFYCYLCGGLSAAGAVVAYFMLPSPFLIMFTAGCAVALVISGFWYGRSARKISV
jgi:hypothetical protein